MAAGAGAGDDGLCEWVLRGLLGRRDEPEQFVGIDSRGGDHLGEGRLTAGDGAGLVEHDGVDLVCGLERLRRADQDAVLGAFARRHHDREGGGETERARTGDDQHCNRGDQCQRERGRGPDDEPGHERRDRDEHHGRHEVRRDLVGEALDRCLRSLRLLDEADDLGEHGVGPDLGGLEPERSGLVDRGADDGVAGVLGDRDRLAGHHRLVQSGASVDDDTVDGHLLTRADQDHVAGDDLVDGYLDLDAGANDGGGACLQADELADRLSGSRLGTNFEQPTEEDQRDDHADRLEVDRADV